MQVIEFRDGQRRWISGIFKAADAATAFWQRIPAGQKLHHHLTTIVPDQYPFYVVDTDHYQYLPPVQVLQIVRDLHPTGDDDVHFNLYRIDEDFVPNRPGADIMGRLQHWHIDDSALANLKAHGLP